MDIYSSYNQILMHPDNREKTTFITDQGIFYYTVISFGLKNAGATYLRLVNAMFADFIGSIMHVYIDDMIIKSLKEVDHISHLRQAFEVLKKYNTKLNRAKCLFGVISRNFLG